MAVATHLGFPRLGIRRELKRALESHWAGETTLETLLDTARSLRERHWRFAFEAGIEHIPSNDFSLYDHVLDAAFLVDAVPERYRLERSLQSYFAMARGLQDRENGIDLAPLEMTKWFDTNYHYLVPELHRDQRFRLASGKPFEELQEARAIGIDTRPVLIGPVSFLLLGKIRDVGDALSLLPRLLPVYEELLARLAQEGAEWVQIDEPCLALDLSPDVATAYEDAFERLGTGSTPRLLLASYFEGLRDNLPLALKLPVTAVHLDLVRAPDTLQEALPQLPAGTFLSLGVVDGRNVWKTDLDRALAPLQRAADAIGPDRVLVAPSCSLLHVPVDLDTEPDLDPELRGWLAFATQKLHEVRSLTTALDHGTDAAAEAFEKSRDAMRSRRSSLRIHDPALAIRLADSGPQTASRGPAARRRALQTSRLDLPRFPTTTIGSFPQTKEVRKVRSEFRSGRRSRESYAAFVREEITKAIRFQEEVGLDVLVHGEFERNDMVEYFGERFSGFAFTTNGWVQSYGSRAVKPPILYADVSRPRAITTEWTRHAQSVTSKPVKGMLTGPVTILQWSFVRNDQPREESCRQVALAVRDEVADLDAAGIPIIQIDEPAMREGLPLRRDRRDHYLRWAVNAFRLAASGARDETQIHSHMCYSEFADFLEPITAMDIDVLSIEASRSKMELLDAFRHHHYRNPIGPGVYDIHSPRLPDSDEIEELLRRALEVLLPDQLWINPDCGLKTRRWNEIRPALAAMVEAARRLRQDRQLA